VAHAFLHEKKWHVKGLSRTPDSEKAKALVAKGAQMEKCDVVSEDAASIAKQFQDADCVFAVTSFWDPQWKGKELEVGKKMADAAKLANVKLYVFSGLSDVESISKGKYIAPHFTDKFKCAEYARKLGLKTITVELGFYYQNFQGFFPPKKDETGTLVFTVPVASEKTLIHAVDVDDVGAVVHAAVHHGDHYVGKTVAVCGSIVSIGDMVATFAKVTNQKAKAVTPPPDVTLPNREFYDMLGFFVDFGFYDKSVDMESCKKLHKMTTWEHWLKKSGWKG